MEGSRSGRGFGIFRTIWLAWRASHGYRVFVRGDSWVTIRANDRYLDKTVLVLEEMGWKEVKNDGDEGS